MTSSLSHIFKNVLNKTPFFDRDEPKLRPFLEKTYKKNGYLDRYGASVIITSLIMATFGCIFGYNYFLSSLSMLKKDWSEIRCNPLFMPFAGLINAPPHKSKIAYTAENLSSCLNETLKDVVEVETRATKAGAQVLTKTVGEMGKQMGSVRSLLGNLRKNLGNTFSKTTGKIFNVAVPLNNTFIKAKGGLNKTQGLLSATMYSGLGSFLGLRSFLGVFALMLTIFFKFLQAFTFSLLTIAILNWFIPFVSLPFFSAFLVSLGFLVLFIIFALPILHAIMDILKNTSNVTKYGSQHAKVK
jgi:hypothetical protein